VYLQLRLKHLLLSLHLLPLNVLARPLPATLRLLPLQELLRLLLAILRLLPLQGLLRLLLAILRLLPLSAAPRLLPVILRLLPLSAAPRLLPVILSLLPLQELLSHQVLVLLELNKTRLGQVKVHLSNNKPFSNVQLRKKELGNVRLLKLDQALLHPLPSHRILLLLLRQTLVLKMKHLSEAVGNCQTDTCGIHGKACKQEPVLKI
jgi:hypothetical protein